MLEIFPYSRLQVEDYSNMVANYFLGRGYKKGDSVALFMINRPEWIITWLGLVKIGVIPALINCSIRKKQLLHTTSVANCRAMIYGLELESGARSDVVGEEEPSLTNLFPLSCEGDPRGDRGDVQRQV